MDRSRLSRFANQSLRELPLDVPVYVSTTDSVESAVTRMREASQPCVLIGAPAALEGIFTERDVLTRCMGEGFDWMQPIGPDLMTRSPFTVSSAKSVVEAIATFRQLSYRTLPVVEDGRVLGLLRVGDILAQIAEAFPEEVLNLPPRPHQVMEKQEGG